MPDAEEEQHTEAEPESEAEAEPEAKAQAQSGNPHPAQELASPPITPPRRRTDEPEWDER